MDSRYKCKGKFELGAWDELLDITGAHIDQNQALTESFYWQGSVFLERDQFLDAVVAFQEALALDAHHGPSLLKLAFTKLKICDWQGLEFITNRL
ncbi:MAG: hypothetical protein ACKOAD_01360 [Gammaproteobacteria bacterium]